MHGRLSGVSSGGPEANTRVRGQWGTSSSPHRARFRCCRRRAPAARVSRSAGLHTRCVSTRRRPDAGRTQPVRPCVAALPQRTVVLLRSPRSHPGARRGFSCHDAFRRWSRGRRDARSGVDSSLVGPQGRGPKGVGALVIRDGGAFPPSFAAAPGRVAAPAPRLGRDCRAPRRAFRKRDLGKMDRSRAARSLRPLAGLAPDAIMSAARPTASQHVARRAARHRSRNAGHRARSGRYRRQRRCRLLVGQGRGEPRSRGDGGRAGHRPRRHPRQPRLEFN